MTAALIPLGRIMATPGALSLLATAGIDPGELPRNPMAHGSEALLDESRHQEMINDTLSYRTLFNRIALKLLGYDGPYIDYSAKEWPERFLEAPLAGRG